MTLSTGIKLSHYEILSPIGKGGMGEVYQAKDTKLGRDVAIKVLPQEFARDTNRVARFQREAKLLASLNHPNIAAIYGLEESDGTNFLVMELVEGETLDERINSDSIPVEEALKLALQIAEALEAAHERGVIHRDLKPANIKVTPDGKVKVLDFGLAKAFAGEQDDLNLSNSPTLSVAATQQGVILGTAAYMSPEQARGKEVDKRADVWAFGVVLFEMLTGKQIFTGDTVSDTLASVLAREPDWQNLSASLHPRIRLLLERCLKKDPRNRYGVISDARVDIQEVLSDPDGVFIESASAVEHKPRLQEVMPWIVVALVIGAIAAGIIVWNIREPDPPEVIRFEYELPENQQLVPVPVKFDISPDGKHFVYGTPEGLYLKRLDTLEAKFIPGSDGSTLGPFFSPDGKSIGYLSEKDQKLKSIGINGEIPTVICDLGAFRGASWNKEGFILFGTPDGKIMRVSATGGNPEVIFEAKSGIPFNPQILSDGKTLLYTNATVTITEPKIMAKPLDSEEPEELFPGWALRYLPSGHLIYRDVDNNICAVPFDSETLKTTGRHVPMIPGEVVSAAVSNSGTLIYTPSGLQQPDLQNTLVWVDTEGNETQIGAPPNSYYQPKISPDGKSIAFVSGIEPNLDINIWDIVRKNPNKLISKESTEMQPIWTFDSERIIYWSDFEGSERDGIYWRQANGTGKPEILLLSPNYSLLPWSLSRDGGFLLINELPSLTNADTSVLSMGRDREKKVLLDEEYFEAHPTFSPDHLWMAYASTELHPAGNNAEIYVRPFPKIEKDRIKVSSDGGSCPLWAPDGKTLYYLSADNTVMAVNYETEINLKFEIPKQLFQSQYIPFSGTSGCPWDIHPDGDRFVMIKPTSAKSEAPATTGPRQIIVIKNWIEELKEKVPVD